MNQSSNITTVTKSESEQKPLLSWSINSAENREVERRINEKCMKEPVAYVPTVWQVITRGLGVAAGIGLYRWIGKVPSRG